MQIAFSYPVIITSAVIAQGFFAASVLGLSRENRLSNRLLALLLCSISLWLLDTFFKISGIYNQDPNYYFHPIYYSWAFGPLLYFYVRTLTIKEFKFKWPDILHFLPVLGQAGLYWFLTFQNYNFKRWYWLEVHRPFTYRIEFDATFLSLGIYLLLSLRLLIKYQSWLDNHYSEFSKIRLHWLKILLIIQLCLCILWLGEVIFRDFYDTYPQYTVITLGILTLVLAFGGIRQSSLSKIDFSDKKTDVAEKQPAIDDTILEKIRWRMEIEKDFMNPTLTLKDFAETLNLPARTVSQHINQGLQKSFVDFVNEYRVAEVKHKLARADLKTYTLLAIALESGFNSKSSFNRIFKKFTGKAPSQYISRAK